MDDYRDQLLKHLATLEGHREGVYNDSKGVPSSGYGFNLNDVNVKRAITSQGKDPELIKSGVQTLDESESKNIKDIIIRNKEKELKSFIDKDIFDNMKPNEKAALMSTIYNSNSPFTPVNAGRLAQGDKIGFVRDLLGYADQPGILYRRLKDAQLFADPTEFAGAFKIMEPDERKKYLDMLNKVKNENTRKQYLEEFGPYLEEPKQQFLPLQNLLNPKIK